MFLKNQKFIFLFKLIRKLKNDDIFASSAQLSYYLVLAFFPFMMLILTLVGYLNIDEQVVVNGMKFLFPTNVHNLIIYTLNQIINVRDNSALWISILMVLFAASTGFRGVIKAINKSYGMVESRCFPVVWIVSIISTVLLTISILANLLFLVFGDSIAVFLLNKFSLPDSIFDYWNLLRYVIIIFFVIFILASIYKFTPSYKARWKHVYIGAIFSTLCWLIVSLFLSKFMGKTTRMSILYGGLSAMFGLMSWLYVSSFIFIVGMQINSVLAIQRCTKSVAISKSNLSTDDIINV